MPAGPTRHPKDSRRQRLASTVPAAAAFALEVAAAVAGAADAAGAAAAAVGPVPAACRAAGRAGELRRVQ